MIARNLANKIPRCNPSFEVAGIAYNGLSALELIESANPDIIITDMEMPGMHGRELLQTLSDRYPAIQKIVVSGYGDFSYTSSAIENNVVSYLLKPVDTAKLKQLLNNIEKNYLITQNEIFDKLKLSRTSTDEFVSQMKEYISLHYSDEIDLSLIASKLGFTPSYLTKIFKKHEGISPVHFIRNCRMAAAKKYLSDPLYTIRDVAELTGFHDQFYFSRLFKQQYGITPSQFRQTLQHSPE